MRVDRLTVACLERVCNREASKKYRNFSHAVFEVCVCVGEGQESYGLGIRYLLMSRQGETIVAVG